ncbi:MAG TPA: hypothetical protein VGB55_10955 [Tepidisphaeraceae bacterium]
MDAETTQVFDTVRQWPRLRQIDLMRALLNSIAQETPRGPRPSADTLFGIARGEGPAPTDEQVKEWIDQARTEKYGR